MNELFDEVKLKKAFTLNSFGVQMRYPNKIVKLTKNENAIVIAEEFRAFIIDLIEL